MGERETLFSVFDGPMWCEDFDADLLKLIPDARSFLGDTADIEMYCYCTPDGTGKINCPAAWWTDAGLTAFFALPGFGSIAPPGYVGGKEIVACTFWEAVRDEWVHSSVIRVNWRHDIWNPPDDLMMRLMYDLRGWTPLSDDERTEIHGHVEKSLRAAADRLRGVL